MYNYHTGYWDMESNTSIMLQHNDVFSYKQIREKIIKAANAVIGESNYWQDDIIASTTICFSDLWYGTIDILKRDHGFTMPDLQVCFSEYDFVIREKFDARNS